MAASRGIKPQDVDRLLDGATMHQQLPAPRLPQAGKKCGDCPPLVIPRRSYTPARPGCTGFVEAHLAAALVLLTEGREGQAYRLRVISLRRGRGRVPGVGGVARSYPRGL